ncbi:MAG: outer membrane lipoprotein carrier protein LolA [Desulfohalobiaceae bacterium]|nr:outer membrane lipoprotein carrier protein LolA [Desulfohalobiaceae bacterium]
MHLKPFLSALLTLLCIIVFSSGPVQGTDVSGSIQKKYQSIQSLKTDFVQELTNASSGEQEVHHGTIYYLKPGLVRWEEEKPGQELLIVTKRVVWDYFPEEGVAYKYDLKEKFESKTMLRFITGDVDLAEDYSLVDQGMDQGWKKIKLIPKNPEPSLVLAYIWVDEQQNLLRQILLVDFFGNGNQLTFSDLQLDISLDESLFRFRPPEGVIVRDNTSPDGS